MASREEKRERKAAYSPDTLNAQRFAASLGCASALVVYVGICGTLFAATGWAIVVVLALPALMVLGSWLLQALYGLSILLAVRWRWTPRGIRCLVISSHSPNWEGHIRNNWMPRLAHVAVTLNWSERASWKPSLAVRVFHHFCGRENFNPCVVVFQGLGHPLVFRFYEAFRQVKAGRPEYLERLESELFLHLDLGERGRPGRLLG